jgi:alkylation response protein AidB-like acyl-CoA dehydrogenase
MADVGLYRLLTPRIYGGHEAAPADFFEAIEQLAQLDAAAAWCAFISCTSGVKAAYLPDAAARQLFGPPGVKLAGVFAPRGRAVAAQQDGVDGVRVSGRWSWGSGSANADLVSAGCLLMGPDGQPQCLADGTPRVMSVVLAGHQVRLLNNWDSMGLQGSGSGEFEVQDAFVPMAHTSSLLDGPRLHTPLYRFPVFGLLAVGIAAVACGVARDALDVFIQQASASVPQAGTKPLAARATVQEAVARAEAQLRSARAFLLQAIDTAWQAALVQGDTAEPLPVAHRRDIRLACTHSVHTAAAVVDRIYTLGGGGAVFNSSPLQRALRNVPVATQHMMVADSTWELTGRLLLNQPTQVAML